MTPYPGVHFQSRMARPLLAACLSLAFLWLLALSVSPQLHARVHGDAGRIEHSCAVTLIASGSYEHVMPQPLIAPEPPVFGATMWRPLTTVDISLFTGAALLEHAPPTQS